MSGNSINFNNNKIKKSEFYNSKNKKIFNIDDIDVNKILVSKKNDMAKIILLYTLLDNDNDIIRPLCLKLSKMTGYINEFNENKNTITMSLKVNDKQLIKYGKD